MESIRPVIGDSELRDKTPNDDSECISGAEVADGALQLSCARCEDPHWAVTLHRARACEIFLRSQAHSLEVNMAEVFTKR